MHSKNPFDVLGIPRPTKMGPLSAEQLAAAKKAFRKLSMQYHPDREGGNEEKFKEVKTAWEQIESGRLNGSPHKSTEDMDDILRAFKEQYSPHWKPNNSPFNEFVAPTQFIGRVSFQQAFNGFSLNVRVGEKSGVVTIPPKTPHQFTGKYSLPDGTAVSVTTIIEDAKFKQREPVGTVKRISSEGVIAATGDLETTIEVDAIDILLGAWVTVEDFLGDKFAVRVPQGFNPANYLKVANKGYHNWDTANTKPVMPRADLYVKVIPVFKKTDQLDIDKAKQLYEAVSNASTKPT